jgi:KaiC/GvpD/RAD55 family RecA-like ATPase
MRTAAAWVPALRDLGRGEPISTGIAQLDLSLRGGIRPGQVLALLGAPGAGKTTFGLQLMCEFALSGMPSYVVAADEPWPGLLTRLAQMLGCPRDEAERGQPEDALIERLAPLPLSLCDMHAGPMLEEALDAIRATGERVALLVDSLQRVRAQTDASDPRLNIDGRLTSLRKFASEGHLVLCTSETSRAWYSPRSPQRQTTALAAAKESGSIEYVVDIAIWMRVRDGVVEVGFAKNRSGIGIPSDDKPALRLRLDRERARFDVDGDGSGAPVDIEDADVERVVSLVASPPAGLPLATQRDLREALSGMSAARRNKAIQRALRTGRISGGDGDPYRVGLAADDVSACPAPP